MNKTDIRNAAISGIPLNGSDVATISRNRRTMTLRHVWSEDTDGRVIDGVSRAWRREARRVANTTGKPVEVYSKEGSMLDEIEPDKAAERERHHATRKSPAQLDREIAEALAKPANGDAASTDAAEFQRRRNLPHVEIRRMFTESTSDIHLSLGGVDLGSRHDTWKHGKVVSTHYVLTPISRLVAQLLDDERVALDAMLEGNGNGKRSAEINALIPDPAQRTYVKMLANQLKGSPPR